MKREIITAVVVTLVFGLSSLSYAKYLKGYKVVGALNPNIRTTLLSGICIPKVVLKENANERKKKGTFGQV